MFEKYLSIYLNTLQKYSVSTTLKGRLKIVTTMSFKVLILNISKIIKGDKYDEKNVFCYKHYFPDKLIKNIFKIYETS